MGFGSKIACLGLVAAVVSGCVNTERERAQAAQREYEACAAEHGDDHIQCVELREVARQEWARYERAAKRQWGNRDEDGTEM